MRPYASATFTYCCSAILQRERAAIIPNVNSMFQGYIGLKERPNQNTFMFTSIDFEVDPIYQEWHSSYQKGYWNLFNVLATASEFKPADSCSSYRDGHKHECHHSMPIQTPCGSGQRFPYAIANSVTKAVKPGSEADTSAAQSSPTKTPQAPEEDCEACRLSRRGASHTSEEMQEGKEEGDQKGASRGGRQGREVE